LTLTFCATIALSSASASDQIYFPQDTNITDLLVQKINAETVRIDLSSWYLSEHAIGIAVANRWAAGVPVRIMGDRGAIFEADANTRREFMWLASQGIPIRLRYNPSWFPEINHWKMVLLVGQNLTVFGSGNFAPTELAPVSATNYTDETIMFTDDPALINGFKTKFDVMWNDTTTEPESMIGPGPYFKNWNDACALESNCASYYTTYPNPTPMIINTARLEPDYPMPPDMIWGQGFGFNSRLTTEIYNEHTRVDLVVYRLTVDNITEALLTQFRAGVPVRIIVDTAQYANRLWPEYWITHANIDKLYAAGVSIKLRVHDGVTHMKMLVTSTYATNASSNFTANWQRDHDYFVSASLKPAIYQAMKDKFQAMWIDTLGFRDFTPQPPDAANQVSPVSGVIGVSTAPTLVWNKAPFATSYDVYLGTSQDNMALVANVPAVLANNPPDTYSWTPSNPLATGAMYFWRVVSRTFATPVNPAMIANSAIWSFTTTGTGSAPGAPSSPVPGNGAASIATNATLTWSAVGATSYDVRFGTSNPPPQVSTDQPAASYTPAGLSNSTAYFWQIVARNGNGSTTGPVWSFTTAAAVLPPGTPGNPNPVDGATGVAVTSTLMWSASGATSYDVRFGPTNPPPLVSTGQTATSYLPSTTANNTTYFWQIVAHNSGGDTTGPVWSFTTAPPLPGPAVPNSPNPPNGAVWVTVNPSLSWQSAAASSYEIRLGTTNPPPTVVASTPNWYYGPPTLNGGTTYYWQIVATNSSGSTPGPVWTFSTDPTAGPPPAPGAPGSPNPANAATNVATTPTLTWTSSNATSYDVNFGTSNPPAQVTSGQASASYTPAALANSTTYFWQIVAHNTGGTTTGPVWSFTTVTATPPPGAPASPNPADVATGVSTTPTLTWSSSGATSYDVKFGASNPPAQVSGGQAAASYTPSALLNSTTYFWQIVAHNSGGDTTGPVWSFTTVAAMPPPPGTPASPNPADVATGVSTTPTLTWSSSGATSYDVKFGASNPPLQVSTGQTSASYTTGALANSTTYFWQIVGHNSSGDTVGPVWSFTTVAAAPPPPGTPANPSPATGASGVGTTPTLTWTSSNATSYDVKFGTTNPPAQVSTGQTGASFTPPALANSTTYFWQIVAHNSSGDATGSTWSFTTAAPAPTGNIVIYASDITAGALHGNWAFASDATSPNGTKIVSADNAWATTANPIAAPTDYIDVTFNAIAGTPYTIWLRLQALNNSKYNDSVWVQFSDAQAGGSTVYPMNTTSGLLVNLATDSVAASLNGWGWKNGAYWFSQPTTVTFPTTGTHTLRIQIREDGVQFDQIVLSPTTYLNVAPGPVGGDSTIVPKS
jgi:phosphatidylserine/phosphatidylglycerophosphate/cardiolipin synthase-like enzyme